MFEVIKAMVSLAEELGVKFKYDHEVTNIEVVQGVARKVVTKTEDFDADIVVGSADYQHLDQQVLEKNIVTILKNIGNPELWLPLLYCFISV